jgi:molybdenum cofactor biosynthesis enzyme MoaA
MCYFSIKDWGKKNKGSFNNEELGILADIFFKKAYQLYIGCGAEPTMFKDFMNLVILGKNNKIPFIGFVTNGQLLTEEHIKKFIFFGLDEISISSHGVRKETYEKLMVNASFDKLMNLLSLIDRLKDENKSKVPVVRLNYTVNPDNLEELDEFFENYGKYNIGVLQIRPIYDLGDTAYKNKNLASFMNKYNIIIEKLHNECKMRKIIFMANRLDPSYQSANYPAVIVNYVRRYISPQYVWDTDFNWRTESLKNYSRRIKWRASLFKNIFLNIDKIAKPTSMLSYEID